MEAPHRPVRGFHFAVDGDVDSVNGDVAGYR